RSPPSPPGRPGSLATTRAAWPRLPQCSASTGADPPNECRRRLCSWRHRGRQRTFLVAYSHSLPCSYGLSRPCNCSGLWKTPDLSLASPHVPPRGGHALRSSDGRLVGTTARSPTLSQFADTRGRPAAACRLDDLCEFGREGKGGVKKTLPLCTISCGGLGPVSGTRCRRSWPSPDPPDRALSPPASPRRSGA